MTMETQEFIDQSHLDAPTLNAWIDAEWLLPVSSRQKLLFSEADLARARLIRDLKVDFAVNDEGIAIVLHLLDQFHGLRRLLRDMQAIEMSDRAGDVG
jgi:chaperone modulatory protein CbpM